MSKLKIIFFCIGFIFTTICCFNRVYADESSDNTETTEQLSNNEENVLYVNESCCEYTRIRRTYKPLRC